MSDKPDIIGYFGVIVPHRQFWQGFFLSKAFDATAEVTLNNMKEHIGGRYMPPSAVIENVPGVPAENQPWIGATSAGLIQCALDLDPLDPDTDTHKVARCRWCCIGSPGSPISMFSAYRTALAP